LIDSHHLACPTQLCSHPKMKSPRQRPAKGPRSPHTGPFDARGRIQPKSRSRPRSQFGASPGSPLTKPVPRTCSAGSMLVVLVVALGSPRGCLRDDRGVARTVNGQCSAPLALESSGSPFCQTGPKARFRHSCEPHAQERSPNKPAGTRGSSPSAENKISTLSKYLPLG
jgi:hypothetical protein